MKHETQFFTFTFLTILISISLVTSRTGMHFPEINGQNNPLYNSAEAAQRSNTFSGAVHQDKKRDIALIAEGRASYYANQFQGRKTANGETFNMHSLTAAHPSLPFGTWVKVTNLRNGRDVVVRINDRGPFVKGRIIDLSIGAAKELGILKSGTARVKLEALESVPSASSNG